MSIERVVYFRQRISLKNKQNIFRFLVGQFVAFQGNFFLSWCIRRFNAFTHKWMSYPLLAQTSFVTYDFVSEYWWIVPIYIIVSYLVLFRNTADTVINISDNCQQDVECRMCGSTYISVAMPDDAITNAFSR